MNPKISIITPSFNQGKFLEATILSVLEQNYPNLEYMVIDGGSTDQSVDIIKKYQKHLTFWVSEKDRGQTHAINKGFQRASGELINWLNSDDLLEAGALKRLVHEYLQHPDADVYFGDYRAIDAQDRLLYARKSAPYQPSALFWGRQLSSQPAVFFRRSLLLDYGYLNENQQFCMDTEFWIRLAQSGASFRQIKHSLGITRAHGDAKTTRLQQVLHKEHKQIARQHDALRWFRAGSMAEEIYFIGMNRSWRLFAAARRLISRGDFTFMSATRALKIIEQEN